MMTIRIGHSPDPDDAFMFYALTHKKVDAPGLAIEYVLEEIESLNRRAFTGELEVTAISAAMYLLVADHYRILDPGAAMGLGYGPILVAREPIPFNEIEERVVAIPGRHTTASLLLRMYCGDPPTIEVPFDKIPTVVVEGQADVGLLIHEGQITYQAMGLVKVMDLGQKWREESDLPIPLGINIVRRDVEESVARAISGALRESILYAQSHVDEALGYAMQFSRGMDRETCRRFVSMYVNDYTVTLGETGRRALEQLYRQAFVRKLIPQIPAIDPI
jgi:1,4-dihydroxy-6-naphthoate synthase